MSERGNSWTEVPPPRRRMLQRAAVALEREEEKESVEGRRGHADGGRERDG